MSSGFKRKRDDADEDDEPAYGLRQILPVANLPSNFEGEPEDGMQYLFTVRYAPLSYSHLHRLTVSQERNASATGSQARPEPIRYSSPRTCTAIGVHVHSICDRTQPSLPKITHPILRMALDVHSPVREFPQGVRTPHYI